MNTCSIIVAVENGLSRNKLFFSRLFHNTDLPFELLIVDNGTTDGTGAYLNELPNRKLIRFPVNMGFAKAWNSAVRFSSGKAVAFVGASCIMPRGWLSAMAKEIDRGRRVGLVRGLDRATVLKYRNLFTRYADRVEKVPPGAFSSEDDLNAAYGGSFDNFAAELGQRFQNFRIPSSSAGCFLVPRELLKAGNLFPEGYDNRASDLDTNLTTRLTQVWRCKTVVTARAYTHL